MSTSEKFVRWSSPSCCSTSVMAIILLLTQRLRSGAGERVQAAAFLGPSLLPDRDRPALPGDRDRVAVAARRRAVRPAVRRPGQLQDPGSRTRRRSPSCATPCCGGPDAALLDRHRARVMPSSSTAPGSEEVRQALIFMPIVISHGGRPDHREVRSRLQGRRVRADRPAETRSWSGSHLDTYNFLLTGPAGTRCSSSSPGSWIQAGFAMTIPSASIKAIPDDIMPRRRASTGGRPKMFHTSPSRSDPPVADRGAHDHHHRHPEGLRHRADRHRWQPQHQRPGLRVLPPELRRRGPGWVNHRDRGRHLHPGDPRSSSTTSVRCKLEGR